MIVVQVYEGLGNQLFQYAMGRAVAHRFGASLKVDATWFDTNQGGAQRASGKRHYRLDAFHIEAPLATRRDLAYHCPAKSPTGRWVDKLLRLGGSQMATQIYERGMWYQPERLASAGPSACIIGYWQSEKYFAPIAEQIRREFRLRETPDVLAAREQAARWRREAAGPLVALHVRRGDLVPFLLNGTLHKNHGPPTCAGYARAAMTSFPAGSRFVVVAEPGERAWCRQNLIGDDIVYFDGKSDLADFAMLQACDHNVIANSTFSWWAAWLNPNPAKRVIAPSPWFWPDSPDWRRSDDLVPDRWQTIHSDAVEAADAEAADAEAGARSVNAGTSVAA